MTPDQNIPRAELVVRTAMQQDATPDQVVAALEAAGLLVRASSLPAAPRPEVQPDLAWKLRCRQASALVGRLLPQVRSIPEVLAVAAEGDQVRVIVRPAEVATWERWVTALAVDRSTVRYEGRSATGTGRVGGVPVLLVGRGVPQLTTAALLAGREASR